MSTVTFTFNDAPGGLIAFRADYVGGYDAQSQAHRLSNQLIKYLEDQAISMVMTLPDDEATPRPSRVIHG